MPMITSLENNMLKQSVGVKMVSVSIKAGFGKLLKGAR